MKDIYETLTNRFVESLKKGIVPWHRSWLQVRNLVSDKPYQGVNQLGLGVASYRSPYWMTFKQALDQGGHVRKGEKSREIVFWKFLAALDPSGRPVVKEGGASQRRPFIRWSNVFNLEQTEGITPPNQAPARQIDSLKVAESFVQQSNLCPIRIVRGDPAYIPSIDVIEMPPIESCQSPAHYYHSLFHEMGHATGHASRLDRDGVARFDDRFGGERYAKEELIAELTSSFLSNEAGILDQVQFERSTAYLDIWIRRLEEDPKLIIQAASQAQKASDFIRGRHLAETTSEEASADATELHPEQELDLCRISEKPSQSRLHL